VNIYALLSRGPGYDPAQLQQQQQRHQQHLIRNLKKRAAAFGFQLVPSTLLSS